MDSADFIEELRPFLLQTTDHFVHELLSFAKAPLDMTAYDECVVYPWPEESSRAVTSFNQVNINGEREGIIKIVAKPARFLVMQLQILNDYHYSFP